MAEEIVPLEAVPMDVVDACVDVLRQTPAALLTDIDGTISAIAPTPFEATVHPGALAALARLAPRLAAVAVVSGRAPQAGVAMVGLPELIYVGNHGMERIVQGAPWTHPAAAEARAAIARALAEIEAEVREQVDAPWLLVENKGVTGTVHYRLAPDHAAAAAMLESLARVAAERNGLRVSPGRMIVELRPALAINKGTAIRDLAHDFELRGLVFFGDDVTDVDGFRALRDLRAAGAATLSVGVLGLETPHTQRVPGRGGLGGEWAGAIADEADMTVDGVPACAEVLLAIADRLEGVDRQTAAGTEALAEAILTADEEPGSSPGDRSRES